jgi:hypothetical protein
MEGEKGQKSIDENAILTFLTETQNGEFGVIPTSACQLPRIEAQREENYEAIYFYSFQ